MSDKKLLEESTIRRFQTLANIKPLNVLEEGKKSGSAHEKAESPAKAERPKGHEGEKKELKKAPAKSKKPVKENARPGVTFMREDDSNATESVMHEEVEEGTLEEEAVEEMFMGEAEGEEAGGGMGMGDGEEAGEEGGEDIKPEVEALVSALNGLLVKVGKKDLEVDVEAGGEEEAGEAGEAGGEEAPVMEAAKTKKEEGYGMKKEAKKKKPAPAEEAGVYESLDLEVEDDEALAEELTRRVAARLMAEMKKAKKGVTEASGKGWLSKPGKASPAKGHGPSKKAFGTKSKGL